MACYILMGWLVIAALKPTIEAVTWKGFAWLLAGGISYTVGAVLYKLGKKRRYFHAVFHVFVVLGSLLQAVCILKYVL
jgi:hemolysin III